jgi:hypothetical protein
MVIAQKKSNTNIVVFMAKIIPLSIFRGKPYRLRERSAMIPKAIS